MFFYLIRQKFISLIHCHETLTCVTRGQDNVDIYFDVFRLRRKIELSIVSFVTSLPSVRKKLLLKKFFKMNINSVSIRVGIIFLTIVIKYSKGLTFSYQQSEQRKHPISRHFLRLF